MCLERSDWRTSVGNVEIASLVQDRVECSDRHAPLTYHVLPLLNELLGNLLAQVNRIERHVLNQTA